MVVAGSYPQPLYRQDRDGERCEQRGQVVLGGTIICFENLHGKRSQGPGCTVRGPDWVRS